MAGENVSAQAEEGKDKNTRQYYDICEHLYALKDIAETQAQNGSFEEAGLMRVFASSLENIIDALDVLVLHGEEVQS